MEKNYHMTPGQFREEGKKLIDWIADYYEQVENYPVLSTVQPGDIRKQLPPQAPEKGEPFDAMMSDVNKLIMPGITHWQSPNFFAYFQSNTSGPSILGELLSAGLGVQGMLWATSPACTELESQVMDWLVDMMGLPAHFKTTASGGGVIQDTASNAALAALLAARERKTNFSSNLTGESSRLVAYVSTQTHSSVEKGIKVMGIGTNRLRKIEVDEHFAMRPEALENQLKKDMKNGFIPFFVCGTVGTTSSNAVDPLREIGEICKKYDVWFHVDAAMSGTAAVCPEFRSHFDGLQLADSYAFNPHKWMFTNFDCDCFYVADKAILIKTLSILPEYLKNEATEKGAVIDYRDWHVQLGRRFRALKLWFVIRHYGAEGLRYHIGEHIRLARELASWIKTSADFELLNEPPFNLVCFRHKASDEFNKKLMDRLNKSGRIYLTHTVLNGTFWLRMSIGQTQTKQEHVARAWELIREMAKQ
ncbi:pyridoxal-dependent decarboxylase [Gaoshiqia sediminis]|uniref:Pyridoxal-dependent decarboxylase n=1 Tax=Gaoshiqia sediminis TaxID=2986998 RepID=A0AA42CAF3_9BACT|nr:pyridoxal-dependent decarboxylase [Gaoshiqia sediminis]MCW0483440.1 pyridoxal-dependent decarboxylase [Gaoshiqia sediminis]